MEKVGLRPWCGQPSDRGRLKNRTEQNILRRNEKLLTPRYTGRVSISFHFVTLYFELLLMISMFKRAGYREVKPACQRSRLEAI